MGPKPTAILWDHDGVLVDTEPLYFQATRQILAQIGIEFTLEEYQQWLLVEGRGVWHLARDRGVAQEEIDKLRVARDGLYRNLLANGDIMAVATLRLLERLKPHYRMAVVTTSLRMHFDAIHARTGLRELVEFVLTREDYDQCKPHPEPYLRALERLALPAEECLVVEDSERGLRAARAAGLRCWVVRSEMTAGCSFQAAERTFASLAEVSKALKYLCSLGVERKPTRHDVLTVGTTAPGTAAVEPCEFFLFPPTPRG